MSRFRLGLQSFARDMRESVPIEWALLLAILAFAVALVISVVTGAHA